MGNSASAESMQKSVDDMLGITWKPKTPPSNQDMIKKAIEAIDNELKTLHFKIMVNNNEKAKLEDLLIHVNNGEIGDGVFVKNEPVNNPEQVAKPEQVNKPEQLASNEFYVLEKNIISSYKIIKN